MTEPLYKVLVDGRSCHGGKMEWSLPNGKPGDWHEVDGKIALCARGIHLTSKPEEWYRPGCRVYRAEPGGECYGSDGSKSVYRAARLVEAVDHPWPAWFASAVDFIEREIPAVRWLQPDGKPDPGWRLFTGKTWAAARDAAWDAAKGAAWAAARDAARDAAWAAARAAAKGAARAAAWDAARDAARAAAWDAARDAAWDAARDAAGAAAGDAAGECLIRMTADLSIEQRHRDHMAARWRVRTKGYALLCDVNGVLYVYAKEGR